MRHESAIKSRGCGARFFIKEIMKSMFALTFLKKKKVNFTTSREFQNTDVFSENLTDDR